MAQKPSLPKGTRDFGPEQMFKRNYILNTIKKVFQKYGFLPLETPAMENLSVLTGKYGDEGDQLLYRVLNSGDFLGKTNAEDYQAGSKAMSSKITEKGLKYDLTVPFARHVVMNQHQIAFPFKRYQIQPVWRADRPQKGRYREFYQCDADVIGTQSLICEAELMCMVHEVFDHFGFKDFKVSLSSRKVLEGIAEVCGLFNQFTTFCTILDKIDKIGEEKVSNELINLGLAEDKCCDLFDILNNSIDPLASVKEYLKPSPIGRQGVEEIETTFDHLKTLGLEKHQIVFDPALARGLSYYTGVIYEVKPTSIKMGTITAGGRYDALTGIFGLKGMSGVGISFGVDRIYDTLEELGLYPQSIAHSSQVLVTNFDSDSETKALALTASLRAANIPAEIYPDSAKLKKQMTYANNKGIPFVLMVGSQEIEKNMYVLKDMNTGTQKELSPEQLIDELK